MVANHRELVLLGGLMIFGPKASAHHPTPVAVPTVAWVSSTPPWGSAASGPGVGGLSLPSGSPEEEYWLILFWVQKVLEDPKDQDALNILNSTLQYLRNNRHAARVAGIGSLPLSGNLATTLPPTAEDAQQPAKTEKPVAARLPEPVQTDLQKEVKDISTRIDRLEELILRHDTLLRQQRGER